MPKRVLNKFWGTFFEKFFCPVFHGGSSLWNVFNINSKNFQNSKNAQSRSQIVQKCFEHVLGYLFREISFCVVFHGGSSLRNVSEKFSKFKKRPKPFPICPNVFWTCFGVILSKNFFAQCSTEGRVFEMFLKSFQNSKNAQNRSQKCRKLFWTCFGVNFFEKFFLPSVPWRVESSKCF